jgi:hypothetical protein
MEFIWNNWSQIMDWLAREPVTDWLSILAGYIAFCVALVTLGFLSALLMRYKRVRLIVVGFVGAIAMIAFLAAMFQVHAWLNLYQAWYTQPLGPELKL